MSPFGLCVKVAVTGAAGAVGYSLLPLIASGRMLGPTQHVQLNLFDIEPAMKTLEGVRAELIDCAYPLLDRVIISHEAATALENVDIAIFCGSLPLKPGMKRRDLLHENANIFKEQGRVLGEVAAPDCRVCVVSNPTNTLAYTLLKASNGKLKAKNVTALSRLDHNRATSLLAQRAKTSVDSVRNCIIWGNHNETQVPDINNATVKGIPAREFVNDDAFFDGEFMATVRERGFEIMNLRGFTASLSTAEATANHMHDWIVGTQAGTHVSMAVHSDGNPHDVPADLIFSFPVTCHAGEWQFVDKLCITPKVAQGIMATAENLREEMSSVG